MKTINILRSVQIENWLQLSGSVIKATLSADRAATNPTSDAMPAQNLRDFFISCAVHADMAAGGDSTAARYKSAGSFDILGFAHVENSVELFTNCATAMMSAKRGDGSTSAMDLRDFFMECANIANEITRGDDYPVTQPH